MIGSGLRVGAVTHCLKKALGPRGSVPDHALWLTKVKVNAPVKEGDRQAGARRGSSGIGPMMAL